MTIGPSKLSHRKICQLPNYYPIKNMHKLYLIANLSRVSQVSATIIHGDQLSLQTIL